MPRRIQKPCYAPWLGMRETIGRYRLVRKLAVGGMGEVWLANDEGPKTKGRSVVLKTLLPHLKDDPDFVTMFFDEARIAERLHHENISKIFELGDDGGEYFLAMEFVHGHSLYDIVKALEEQKFTMPIGVKVKIISEAAAGLSHAHAAKSAKGVPLQIIHRDVSPPNILVGYDGGVKLIDFGVAKAANKVARTATGIIKGKYAYMSPEQAYGKDLDQRSDVFALGVVLWELLTQQRLFKRKGEMATLKAVVGATIERPSSLDSKVPEALDDIVIKALSRSRDKRYQTAGALRDDLEAFLRDHKLQASKNTIASFLTSLFNADDDEATQIDDSAFAKSPSQQAVPAPSASSGKISKRSEKGRAPASSNPMAFRTSTIEMSELEQRLDHVATADTVRGVMINAIFKAVIKIAGVEAEGSVRAALGKHSTFVDALDYSSRSYLRFLWKAIDVISIKLKETSPDEAFELIAMYTANALVQSPDGADLKSVDANDPSTFFEPYLSLLNVALKPGQRILSRIESTSAVVVYKDEALPARFHSALLSKLFQKLFNTTPRLEIAKPSPQRFELTLKWS